MKKIFIFVCLCFCSFTLIGCKAKMETDNIQDGLLALSGKKFSVNEFSDYNGRGTNLGRYNAKLECEIIDDRIEFSISVLEYDINGHFRNSYFVTKTPTYTYDETEWTLYFYYRYNDTYLGRGWMEIRTDNEYNINLLSFCMYDPRYGGTFHYFILTDDSFKNNNIHHYWFSPIIIRVYEQFDIYFK